MKTFLIVGLGNPDVEYAFTRHNIGYDLIDVYSENHRMSSSTCNGIKIKQGILGDNKVILLKPCEGMNVSGNQISLVAKYLGITNDNIMVIHDDLDLDFGRIKYKVGGGSGGHNGIKSIISALGENFARFRFGIGKPLKESGTTVLDYVLSNFTSHERADICMLSQVAIELMNDFVAGTNESSMMNIYNKKGNQQ